MICDPVGAVLRGRPDPPNREKQGRPYDGNIIEMKYNPDIHHREKHGGPPRGAPTWGLLTR
jgi:hypothetical protein